MRKILVFLVVFTFSMSYTFAQQKVKAANLQQGSKLQSNVQKSEGSIKKQTPEQRKEYFENKRVKYLKFNDTVFRQQNNIPENFPKYNDNGNVQQDVSNFEKAVKVWISNNEEEHKKIQKVIGI